MKKIETMDELRFLWRDDVGERFSCTVSDAMQPYLEKQSDYYRKEEAAEKICREQVGYTSFSAQIAALQVT